MMTKPFQMIGWRDNWRSLGHLVLVSWRRLVELGSLTFIFIFFSFWLFLSRIWDLVTSRKRMMLLCKKTTTSQNFFSVLLLVALFLIYSISKAIHCTIYYLIPTRILTISKLNEVDNYLCKILFWMHKID